MTSIKRTSFWFSFVSFFLSGVFWTLALGILALVGWYLWQKWPDLQMSIEDLRTAPAFRQSPVTKFLAIQPCTQPIHYRIGQIDPQFHLSRDVLLADTQAAAQIWNDSEGKELFTYDPQAELEVAVIYDSRQALNAEIQQGESALKRQDSDLKPQLATYQRQASQFQKSLADYNAVVASWNQKGGAPPDVYAQLQDQKTQLQNQANQLNAQAKQLNLSTQSFNSQVGQLNKTIGNFNTELGQKPEEGVYIPQDRRIVISLYANNTELTHTLAHELGHALGMEHVGDPQAVMYAYTNQQVKLSADDVGELKRVCSGSDF
jgi:hypothetical protein